MNDILEERLDETQGATGPNVDAIRSKKKSNRASNTTYVLMCLPIVIKTIIFSILPMLWLLMAFQNYNGVKGLFGSDWVGFQNFEYFFKSKDIWRVLGNTLGLNFMFVFIGTPITAVMALFMNEMRNRTATKLFQTIWFIPYLISWTVAQYCTWAILCDNGIINTMLVKFGFTAKDFYAEANDHWWPFILLLCNMWKGQGYSVILDYASLQSLDTEMLEAAELDGANRFQRMWYIEVSHLRRIVAIQLIMAMGGIFRSDFGLFWFIPKNDTYKTLLGTTDVLDTYIYSLSIMDHNYSVGTAIGLIQSLVGMFVMLFTNWIVKKLDEDSAFI